LVKKGALPGKAAGADEDKLSDFVSVTMAPPPRPMLEPVCRIRHPNGLLIECMSWPSADWMGAYFTHDGPRFHDHVGLTFHEHAGPRVRTVWILFE
jgi:hypothetical protein